MELNDRKLKILQAIILDYLETAEPVGSRTISKNYDLGVSPATIRNEMSDLEELGFILQPHTSAGRIPSDKGYRLYVDELMHLHQNQVEHGFYIEQLLQRVDRIESLLKNIAKMLASETSYATIVSSPQIKRAKIKNIQLIAIQERQLLAVIVTDGNIIKNYMIHLTEPIHQTILNRLTFVLNEHLYGLTLEQINLPLIQQLKDFAGENADVINKVLDAIFDTIQSVDDTDVYTSGATNILRFPEFNDIDKATNLMHQLEEKQVLKQIIRQGLEDQKVNIKVTIGCENKLDEMKDCSLVTTTYKLGGEDIGFIGIIGPKRMDYENAISTLSSLMTKMDKIINKLK
ncbi:heat-inducible transcription repressor HrcA [Vallitalea pronyensis]|uniref:Heat-inducible transcription repressor HrcA n=1 Tax=Vallitalea pronyensis TaxID=1348613 RepID=A0A8J8SJR5_9FIRM|nr:heat-inducible transcriptional repressor HrcA [Vallitalea pronyensis]QUI25767.1 heat-inducible transcription repressor HrcA [Vallitalea pronyensis]